MKREDSIEALPDAISSGEFVNYNEKWKHFSF